ncbi:hypothetical protein KFK09_021575 [Dendrobium nobile]|uniref:Uncharacterized protein n=1 Tax=Dendrobium nobile TaxID=94219 RepID=A0A8T3AQQ7_DENNO|nr:hypothetical protein KFK09_021575 [Dendrobium nobile]
MDTDVSLENRLLFYEVLSRLRNCREIKERPKMPRVNPIAHRTLHKIFCAPLFSLSLYSHSSSCSQNPFFPFINKRRRVSLSYHLSLSVSVFSFSHYLRLRPQAKEKQR